MTQVVTYPPGLRAAAAEIGIQLPESEEFDGREALLELSEDFQTAAMHGEDAEADFGGFSLKKLGRGIGRGLKKGVSGLGKGIKKIARNPVVQVLNPAAAVAVHTTDRALGGKGVIKGPLGKVVDVGAGVATSAAGGMGALGKQFGPQLARITGSVRSLTGITGGRAVAFGIPSRRIPLKQAMAGADKLLGDTNVKNAAAVVRNTKAMAALGDPAARRGLAVLHAVGHIRLATQTPPGKRAVPTVLHISPSKLTVRRSPAQVRVLAKRKIAKAPTKTFWQKVVAWFKA